MTTERATTTTATTITTTPGPNDAKAPVGKTSGRQIDYKDTDKKPHSFRYKRGSEFLPRSGAVSVSKENDGTLVIGPTPPGVDVTSDESVQLNEQVKLVAIRKRPCGKAAVTFQDASGRQIVAYDARAARAALKSVSSKKKG